MQPTKELSIGKVRFADIVDGTSNSIAFGEAAGRHQIFVKGAKKKLPNTPGTVGWALNSAFFDFNTAIQVRGVSNDGLTADAACNSVNGTNNTGNPPNGNPRASEGQFYAFHPGTAGSLRADGSVQYISETIAPNVMAALVTRAGGEAVAE